MDLHIVNLNNNKIFAYIIHVRYIDVTSIDENSAIK